MMDEILKELEKNNLTIKQISSRTGINRMTAAKYLAVLEAKGLVKYREEGRAKLFSLVGKR